ncbi:phage regulatory CII family protein [Xanthomonas translucens]|uniref:phage regulatory CII family protein n=1 Tax=Xanthomonas campestris pv. translucens TaxID=343 RepID=UPI000B085A0B|nr:phage regulatory CII family protein [Xanthomonas translucens]UPU47785.1 phage regulatory CII family protein [Xanthomonas translucens pv. undulosa]WLA06528.1 phage regulatory CII family protein [Xanthomonas translucens]
MHIIDAAHKTVHAYPGGSESLAPRIGMSAAVLRNKVNPNNTTHHLTLAEASEVMGVTGDDRILHALAAQHGYTLQRVDTPTTGSLLTALLSASSAKGKLAEIINEALTDGRITPNEANDIATSCGDAQAFLAQVAQHARAAVEKGRAAA